VCEGARAELYNKHTILGFYGLAPHVRVTLSNVEAPATICFIFSGASDPSSGGTYTLALKLSDPSGLVITNHDTSPEISGNLRGERMVTNVFMSFQGTFRKAGTFRVALLVDGREHYVTTLGIEKGNPKAWAP
jgi:hypothetical protein